MYLWLKALHIVAVVLWISTMVAIPAVAACLIRSTTTTPEVFGSLREVFSKLGTPAMIGALGLGLWMAQTAAYFDTSWLLIKLVLVLVLTALHGVIAGRLKRAANPSGALEHGTFERLTIAVGLLMSLVIVLVVMKPTM
ncbi:MAG: CopD family protein [Myxococcota bacterium]